MNLLTGLFRAARKRVMTTDNDMGMFREKLNELVEKKAELPDDEVVKRVDELKEMTVDLPDEEGKAKLDRFLEDFKSVKEQDDAAAKEAASMVADLYEKLDTEAMKDVPDAGGEETTEETTEEVATEEETAPAEGDAAATEEATEAVEETVAKEEKEGETEDADPNPEYSMEELYQFMKKRLAEDGCIKDGCTKDGDEEEAEEEEEEEKEVVTDNAPRIPVTMNGTTAAKGSLADMFNKIKTGGR